ncbi:hypothetical protein QR90_08520 [Deinococcus radiopugnans]|uniref:PPM-type phosphatase domain-containing protein n=1 Tax=Deinococcus radiopugnans TaxID=57497 RepID=A0A0A7KG61_9DEIO|nr:protein phosphatase 2C domain-containing protein [Deinococcus radiopugnans]AIZ45136.1 hypothetical protein QR90_08520 [Deinococcus radiopugnans]
MAVADGATTYSYSQEWANIICTEQARQPLTDANDLMTRLPDWQAAWQQEVQERVAEMSWFAAAKAEQGAFSTFLQLALLPDGTWRALAIGDSCLVQFRKGKPVHRDGEYPFFPLHTSESFAEKPYLLPTRMDLNPRVTEHIRETHGKWRPGDEFLLMTDALAAWFIQEFEQQRFAQDQLRAFYTSAAEADAQPSAETPASQQEVTVLDPRLILDTYLSRYRPISPSGASALTGVDLLTPAPIDLDATFQNWVEETKMSGLLKDDDVSFVHVALKEEGVHA